MEVRLTLQELAEISSHGFPRVSCYGQYGSQAGNGFPRVSRHGSRGSQAGNGLKWPKMDFHGYLVGNGFPRVSRHSPTTKV